jgi:HSP20 family molecular chaperone IbpA
MTQLTNQEQREAARGEMTRDTAVFVPRVDIWENDDEIVLFGEMPGVAKDNLDIQFEDHQLTIHGKVEPRHEGRSLVGSEYGIGDFHRTFTINEGIDVEKISAELKNGMLTLHLPKSEGVKPRKIEVKSG